MTNHDLIFKAVKAVLDLEQLQSTDEHVQAVTANLCKYLLQDLRLLAFNYGVSRDKFLEATR